MSVPIATWTVSGTLAPTRRHQKRMIETRPAMLEDDLPQGDTQARSSCDAARLQARAKRSDVSRANPNVARHQPAADVLAGLAGNRQLEIVDRGRTVERKPGEDSAIDPIDQIDSAPSLDDVTAQCSDDRAPGPGGANDRITQPPQRIRAQAPWAGVSSQSANHGSPGPGRPRLASETLLGRSSSGS